MKKVVMITGVAGFIGYSLAKKLLDLGHTIVGIDNINDYYDVTLKEHRLKMLECYKDKFFFYKVDIANKAALNEVCACHNPEKIIHLAAQAGVRYSLINPSIYITSNLCGFGNILEIARSYNTPLIYASSSSVYGDNNSTSFNEQHNTSEAVSLYAATKKANEVMAHSYSHLFKLPTIGLRFFTVYGPLGRPDMAIYKFTKNILENKQIDVYNNGEMYRDFTYIDDIVDGILATMSYNFLDLEKPYEIFNLGCGNTRKLIDFVKLIEKYCGKKANINFEPLQSGDVLKTSADISKAKKLLNFNPKINIEEGLYRFVEWFKNYYRF